MKLEYFFSLFPLFIAISAIESSTIETSKSTTLNDIHPDILTNLLPHLDNPTKMILGQTSSTFKTLTFNQNAAFKQLANTSMSLNCGADTYLSVTNSGYSIFLNSFEGTNESVTATSARHNQQDTEAYERSVVEKIERNSKCLKGMTLLVRAFEDHNC